MPVYKIANLYVRMDPKYEPLKSQAIPYLTNECKEEDAYDLEHVLDFDVVMERFKNHYPNLTIGEDEYMIYCGLFYKYLRLHDGIMLHSSCVVKDGYAYLFSADSGTGKSTHTQLWLKNYKDAFILNDDKPAVLLIDNKLYACGTPFSGKTDQNKNIICPIKAIAFLERDPKNSISIMDSKLAIFKLLGQTITPDYEDDCNLMLDIIEKIINTIDIYTLKCNMEDEACFVSYNGMKDSK